MKGKWSGAVDQGLYFDLHSAVDRWIVWVLGLNGGDLV